MRTINAIFGLKSIYLYVVFGKLWTNFENLWTVCSVGVMVKLNDVRNFKILFAIAQSLIGKMDPMRPVDGQLQQKLPLYRFRYYVF